MHGRARMNSLHRDHGGKPTASMIIILFAFLPAETGRVPDGWARFGCRGAVSSLAYGPVTGALGNATSCHTVHGHCACMQVCLSPQPHAVDGPAGDAGSSIAASLYRSARMRHRPNRRAWRKVGTLLQSMSPR